MIYENGQVNLLKKWFRHYWFIPAGLVLLAAVVLGSWYVLPQKKLDIVVIDKTVSFDKVEKEQKTGDFRKHKGLYWILEQQKYTLPDSGRVYDYRTDYIGPHLDSALQITDTALTRFDSAPDLIYLADAYGTEEVAKNQQSGLTLAEMAAVSTASHMGSAVVGEYNITPSRDDDPVRGEIQSFFGAGFTGWIGRYVADLADLSDIPPWALDLQQRQYGRPWDYTGSGILLASEDDQLIVLKDGEDYTGGGLTVSVDEAYQKQYGKLRSRFYNWFQVISADYGSEVIGSYHLSLTDGGNTKAGEILSGGVFPAIVKNTAAAGPVYYFAGDFNDYVARERGNRYLFADRMAALFTYERPGDITRFFHRFYTPLMQGILKDVYRGRDAGQSVQNEPSKPASRIQGKALEIQKDGQWQAFQTRGYNIQPVMPSAETGKYTRDISIYRQLIEAVAEGSGNCVRAYDLLPPEFYRALYEYNAEHADAPVYFFQGIRPPSAVPAGQYLGSAAMEELRYRVELTVDSVGGAGSFEAEGYTYINNVMPYLLGYIADFDVSASSVSALNAGNAGYRYDGEYVSSGGASTPAEGFAAAFCDMIFSAQSKYGQLVPVGAEGNQLLLPNSSWREYANGVEYDVSRISVSEKAGGNFFASYALMPSDEVLRDRAASYGAYRDEKGELPYGGYLREFLSCQTAYPVLIDRLGLPTNIDPAGEEHADTGLSEKQQGSELTRMLSAVYAQGCMGVLISDLNDNWDDCSPEFAPYTIPARSRNLWQNVLDPAENMGVIALSPDDGRKSRMVLSDTELMREVSLETDENFLYMTVLFSREINYDAERMMIGLDTLNRSYGEYKYGETDLATSLSGMEYRVIFDGSRSASLSVVPGYNRSKGRYLPAESYSGIYDTLAELPYGTFDYSGNCFYQTGSTLHLRLPWNLLNFANPAAKSVLSDGRTPSQIASDGFGLQTQVTEGLIFSLTVTDLQTGDTAYQFPLTKESNGYKTYRWDGWETVDFTLRRKESYDIIAKYFSQIGR